MATSMVWDYVSMAPPSLYAALIAACLVPLLAAICLGAVQRPPLDPKAPAAIPEDHSIFGAWRFWTNRWEFFGSWIRQSASGNFSFWVGKHPIVGLSGENARKTFFDNKQFGLNEGYSILYGMIPDLKVEGKDGQDVSGSTEFERHFDASIIKMMTRENMVKNLPALISDTRKCLSDLASDPSKTTDPFDSLYKLVFVLTMRTVGCVEMTRDENLLKTVLGLYETFKMSFTPTLVLFPWLPNLAKVKRGLAGVRLYMIISRIIAKRKKSGNREDDPLQEMIDRGDDIGKIIGVMIGALFAAQQNSGINAGWVLLYLATNPEWNAIARAEVNKVADRHCPDPTISLAEKLSTLSYDTWENEFPMLYLCLKDSIRLHANGACFRRNTSGRPIAIGKSGEVVPPGFFASYHIADVHLDSAIYPEPEQWNPSRYLPGREEDRKQTMAFLGWGAGRHPCVGMKFARLEHNIIIAHWLATFERFEIYDGNGTRRHEAPATDFNAYSSGKPKDPVYLKYEPTKTF